MTVTIESICNRWMSSERPLFKGYLISDDGCCCAQGDVLRCSGYTDDQLRTMTQENADAEVAKLLGISRAQSVLLRIENDKEDGCPQDVLLNPAKILGDEWTEIDRFWRHLDAKTPEEWSKIVAAAWDAAWDAAWAAAWAAARAAARDAAGDAARDAAGDAARAAARDAAGDAARDAAGDAAWAAAWDAAGATSEIQGRRTLKSLCFCKLFGFETTHGDGYTKSGRPE